MAEDQDQELIRQLRAEWSNTWKAAADERDKKGYVDSEAREKLAKVETDLNAAVDAKIATQAKRIDDTEARVKALMEKSSRPPGAGIDGGFPQAGLGRKFVESEAFKTCKFAGKFQVQVSLEKTRMDALTRKAVTTITEGGATQIVPPAGAYPIFPYRYGVIPQPFPPPTMRSLIDVVPIEGTNAIEYVTQSWTNAADYQVLEGDKKAQSGVTYTDHTAVVRTIAHYVKVSRQMAADVPFIITSIESNLSRFVLLKEDHELLYGDNSAGHLWGIMPQAQPLAGTPPTSFTAIDILNLAETQVENNLYFPTAYVMNPSTWMSIESLKTTFGAYLLTGVPAADGTQRLWGLPVYTTPQMTAGDFLVGQFPATCALFDRETVTVEMAFQNEDDFIRNLITLRAEERIAFAVFAPAAFVKNAVPLAFPAAMAEAPPAHNAKK